MDKYRNLPPAIGIAIFLTLLILFIAANFFHVGSGFFAGFLDGFFGGLVVGLFIAEITFFFQRRNYKNI